MNEEINRNEGDGQPGGDAKDPETVFNGLADFLEIQGSAEGDSSGLDELFAQSLGETGKPVEKADPVARIVRYNKELQLSKPGNAHLSAAIAENRSVLVDKLRFVQRTNEDGTAYWGWSIRDLTPSEFLDIVYAGDQSTRAFIRNTGLQEKLLGTENVEDVMAGDFRTQGIAPTIINGLIKKAKPVQEAFTEAGKPHASFTVKTLGDLAELYTPILRGEGAQLKEYLQATGLYDKEIGLTISPLCADERKVNVTMQADWRKKTILEDVTSFDRIVRYQSIDDGFTREIPVDINEVAMQAEDFVEKARSEYTNVVKCLQIAGEKEGLFVTIDGQKKAKAGKDYAPAQETEQKE